MESITTPLAPLPTTEELMLYLLAEDLKSRRFFDGLRDLGLDDAWNQVYLGEVILTYARLNTNSNAVLDFYYLLIDEHSKHLRPDRNYSSSLAAAAKAAYQQLMLFAESARAEEKER